MLDSLADTLADALANALRVIDAGTVKVLKAPLAAEESEPVEVPSTRLQV